MIFDWKSPEKKAAYVTGVFPSQKVHLRQRCLCAPGFLTGQAGRWNAQPDAEMPECTPPNTLLPLFYSQQSASHFLAAPTALQSI